LIDRRSSLPNLRAVSSDRSRHDVLAPHQIIAASSIFVLVWGLGSIFGPIIASILANTTRPEGLFWMMGSVHLAVAVDGVFQIAVKEGMAISEQGRYLQVPARASGLIGALTRGRRPR
jgi:hypothetical protein